MRTLFPTKPSSATVVLLVLSVLLAVVGIGGVASGAADDDSEPAQQAHSTTTLGTTTTLAGTADTTTSSSPGPTTTLKSTATTRKTTATTAAPSGDNECTSSPATSNPGGEQPPAVGTYTYVSCTDPSSTTDVKVANGTGGSGVTRREVTTSQGQLGTATATTAYGSGGIVQEKLTIAAQGVTLECDWQPDIVEYPIDLSVGKTWSADSKCDAQTGFGKISIHAVASRKVTGRVTTKIGGTSVNTWVVDSTLNLTFSGGPVARPINGTVNETSVSYFEPTRGMEVYDKSTSEGTGDFAFPKTTAERHLKTLTPS